MTVSDFLSKAVEWLYAFWPLRIVRQWERGIRLYAGEVTDTLDSKNGFAWFPGLHAFWPKIGEIIVHECNWEVVETRPQTVISADGRAITAQFAVTYRIVDLKAYYVSIQNQDMTVIAAVKASAGAIIPEVHWNAMNAIDGLAPAMLAAVKARVRGWGLEVKDVVPTTLVHSRVLRLLTDPSVHKIAVGGGAEE